MRKLYLALPLLLACAAPAAAQQSAHNKEWIARCVSQISETNKPRARAYCTCMAETIDTSEKFERQTELERSYPPVHRECFKKAGFKIPQ